MLNTPVATRRHSASVVISTPRRFEGRSINQPATVSRNHVSSGRSPPSELCLPNTAELPN